jgi:hypothetical protein
MHPPLDLYNNSKSVHHVLSVAIQRRPQFDSAQNNAKMRENSINNHPGPEILKHYNVKPFSATEAS